MERERTDTDAERLSEAKTSLEDLISWSDELPEEFIVGNPTYSRHKFRNNWFQGALSSVRRVARICNDTQLMADAEDCVRRRHEKGTNARTTREEINEIDQLIRRALEKLKNIN